MVYLVRVEIYMIASAVLRFKGLRLNPKRPVIKKGATRSAAYSSLETPGRPSKPSTFINIESNEQKRGAYIGYNDVVHARVLLLTWPVMKALLAFETIATNLSKNKSFKLLHDAAYLFQDIVDPAKTWAITDDTPKDQITQMKSRHLACYLLAMKRDIGRMATFTWQNNTTVQAACAKMFIGVFPDIVLPPLTFPNTPPSLVRSGSATVVLPRLGPYAQEDALESLNRCWNILRYFRYCRQLSPEVWQSRFSLLGITTSIQINESHVPTWMQKPQEAISIEVGKTVEVREADALPDRVFSVLWDRRTNMDENEDLAEVLVKAKKSKTRIPSDQQVLSGDPRLMNSAASLKDSVRRLYNC
ncbi:hypothetical protein MMC11_005296 [Xylographa trunciseda]|nr:hypothetical protein [Xylographa trunciseda]